MNVQKKLKRQKLDDKLYWRNEMKVIAKHSLYLEIVFFLYNKEKENKPIK